MAEARIRFRTLTARLLAIYVPLVSISLLVVFALLEVSYYRTQRSGIVQELRQRLVLESGFFAYELWEFNLEAVKTRLGEIGTLPHVASAVVFDSSGAVLGKVGDIDLPPEAPDFRAEMPLVYRAAGVEDTVGKLVITLHSADIRRDVRVHILENAVVMLVLLAALVGATFFATRRVFGMPIEALRQSIERMKTDNLRQEVDWDSGDELGQVVRAYNEMLRGQAEAERKIRQYQDHLQDLADQRTAELSETSARLRLTLDNIPSGILRTDKDMAIVFTNDRYLELTRASPELVHEGASIPEVCLQMAQRGQFGPGKPADLAETAVADFTKVGVFEVDLPHGVVVEIRREPTSDGGMLLLVNDISARRKAEQEVERVLRDLRESQERLQAILDNSPAFIYMKDLEGRYLVTNRRWREAMGCEQVPPSTLSAHDVFPKDIADAMVKVDREVARRREVREVEVELPRGKELRTYVSLKFPLLDDGGRPYAIGGISTDITERKRAEENLRHVYGILTDSIEYAARIQRSLLPSRQALDEAFAEHFVIWEPRDVIGGDIFWLRENPRGNLIAIADCTGHGVAGAFVTLIATGALDRALLERPLAGPAEILSIMNRMVKEALNQVGPEGESDDGLGLGICLMDPEGWEVTYAGAGLSLWVVRDGVVEEVKGHRRGIGHRSTPLDQDYATARVLVEEGTRFYLATDGFVDQVGGGRNRTFGKRRLAQALEDMADLALADQKATLLETLHAYQGAESRRDDITVVGFVCAS
ncbi:MAG: PAS-domain containing protein [Hyphomicrobiales bacterium]|nr:PAS-domain containing protein [Hyphomicrobiales bacterium]